MLDKEEPEVQTISDPESSKNNKFKFLRLPKKKCIGFAEKF